MSDQPEIHVAENGPVDVDAIMRQIREHLLARKGQSGSAAIPQFNGRFDPALYDHLYRARLMQDQFSIQQNVIPSRVPLIGPLLTFVRRQLHGLTLYYVNQLAQKQITFNTHVLGVLTTLIQELDATPVSAEPVETAQAKN
jgi:hypothetical protein